VIWVYLMGLVMLLILMYVVMPFFSADAGDYSLETLDDSNEQRKMLIQNLRELVADYELGRISEQEFKVSKSEYESKLELFIDRKNSDDSK